MALVLGLVVCQIGDLLNSRAEEPRHGTSFYAFPCQSHHAYFNERGNVTAILHEVLMEQAPFLLKSKS